MTRIILSGKEYGEALEDLIRITNTNLTILAYAIDTQEKQSPRIRRIFGALRRAADAGVNIRILMNTRFNPQRRASSFLPLQEWLDHPGIHLHLHTTDQTQHAKLVIADRSFILIGSHNLTLPALYSQLNVSAIIVDVDAATELERKLDPLFERSRRA
jgi:phosphatidylserine/phosphatidylglycerophosphate/cardiolipin synthase-like enzyme